jgi:hypothetical protein
LAKAKRKRTCENWPPNISSKPTRLKAKSEAGAGQRNLPPEGLLVMRHPGTNFLPGLSVPHAGAVCLSRFMPRLSWRAAKGMISPDAKALGGVRRPGNPDLYRLPDLTSFRIGIIAPSSTFHR